MNSNGLSFSAVFVEGGDGGTYLSIQLISERTSE